MTVSRVESAIKRVSKDAVITKAEAKRVIDAATTASTGKKDPVTPAEAKKIVELYERSTPRPGTGHPPPMGHPGAPHLTAEARTAFNNFFVASRIPAGDNAATVLGQVQNALTSTNWHDKLLPKKPSTTGLFQVSIPYPPGLMDAPGKTAWFDPKKDQFFLNVHGGMPRPDGTQVNAWYGPIPVSKTDAGNNKALIKELKELAPNLSLTHFGEDDSGLSCTFTSRKGPVDKLDARSFLTAFGFNVEKQLASDVFDFQPLNARGWKDLEEAQQDDAGAKAVRTLKDRFAGWEVATVMVSDRQPFGTPVFLAARSPDGEILAFRTQVGGMGF